MGAVYEAARPARLPAMRRWTTVVHVRRVLVAALTAAALSAGPVACDGDRGTTSGGGDRRTTTTDGEAALSSSTTTTTAAPPSVSSTVVAPAGGQPATASCPAVPPRARPPSNRPSYRLDIDVRPSENAIVGRERVRFTPDSDIDRLVFRLWANSPTLAQAGARIDVELPGAHMPDTTTLVLPRPVRAGETTEVDMTWRITLPGSVNDRLSRTGDAIRLGSFFPILPWEEGNGWALEPPTSGFAEASFAPAADFDVSVAVPDGFTVLATGVRDGSGRWKAGAVRDFALSVGRFRVESRTIHGGTELLNLTVAVHEGIDEAPGPYLDKLERVFADFIGRFGPYPWPSYSLAITPNLSGGIEYPMHVMQGPGKIGRTTSHEVAHMWFYGLVMNNQGRDPWIDEGLATYAEARYEGTLGDYRGRPIPPSGRGRTGAPMTYWESRLSAYYRSVYVQGAQAVAALGAADVVDCALRHFVARHAFRSPTSAEVVAALQTVFPDAPAVLARYGIPYGDS